MGRLQGRGMPPLTPCLPHVSLGRKGPGCRRRKVGWWEELSGVCCSRRETCLFISVPPHICLDTVSLCLLSNLSCMSLLCLSLFHTRTFLCLRSGELQLLGIINGTLHAFCTFSYLPHHAAPGLSDSGRTEGKKACSGVK